mmetsp:Transcript_14998/g.19458  ORF Transcript_14998/g.19458 Transcript_14998/m.19458 type:complete len:319 (-) Transcript_14998:271-1227(-)
MAQEKDAVDALAVVVEAVPVQGDNDNSMTGKLRQLKSAFDDGLISKDEFAVAKQRLMQKFIGAEDNTQGFWTQHENIDMCGQGDIEIIHNWKNTHSIDDLKRIVQQKGYSGFTVSNGHPSFGHAALKKFPYQLTPQHCKGIHLCCKHPCMIYIYTPPGHGAAAVAPPPPKFNPLGRAMILVPKGHPQQLIFKEAKHLINGQKAKLTLSGSFEGKGIGKKYGNENRSGPWRYTESAFGPADNAITVQLVQNEYLKLVDCDLTFDVSFWKYEPGNTVNFVGGTNQKEKTLLPGGGRCWEVLPDGTISCKGARHLVLGVPE